MTANQFKDFDSPEWKEGVTFDRAAEILFPELSSEVKATYRLLVIGDPRSEAMRKRAGEAAKKIIQGLTTILKSGQLELRQLHPSDDPQAKWTPVSQDVWKAKGLDHFWHPFNLVIGSSREDQVETRLFTLARSEVHKEKTQKINGISNGIDSSTAERDHHLAPPKGKKGRKAKWDWNSATRELMGLANSPDGLPITQAQIEEHMAQWFLNEFGKTPSESSIRKFVVDRLPPNYRDQ